MSFMIEKDLLPCPFCGRKPRSNGRAGSTSEAKFVHFVVCFCGGYSACAHKMGRGDTPEEAERSAIELWNSRAGYDKLEPEQVVTHMQNAGGL